MRPAYSYSHDTWGSYFPYLCPYMPNTADANCLRKVWINRDIKLRSFLGVTILQCMQNLHSLRVEAQTIHFEMHIPFLQNHRLTANCSSISISLKIWNATILLGTSSRHTVSTVYRCALYKQLTQPWAIKLVYALKCGQQINLHLFILQAGELRR